MAANCIDASYTLEMVDVMLNDHGQTVKWLSETSGLSEWTLRILKSGGRRDVLQSTEDAVRYAYDVSTEDIAIAQKRRSDLIDSESTTRAIRQVIDRGYTQLWIAKKTGINKRTVSLLAQGKQKYVKRATADNLIFLAQQLGAVKLT